jgi:hypothetical protein
MRYAIALAFLVLFAIPALAVPCPGPQITQGWSQAFYNTAVVSSFTYDQLNSWLYVSLKTGYFNDFIGAPVSTAQAFTFTQNADLFFQQNVNPVYHEILLTENCSFLRAENNGILLTK